MIAQSWHKSSAGIFVLAFLAGQAFSQTTVTVPGSAGLWLAGQPAGSRSTNGHVAPGNSPVQVGLPIIGGQVLQFSSTGTVDGRPPDGGSGCFESTSFGISRMDAPCRAVIGVFLADTARPAPPAVNYDGDATALPILRPLVQQPFFVGSGQLAGGGARAIVVPNGATRLFLAVFGLPSSSGTFQVTVSQGTLPPEGPLLRVSGASDLWLAGQAAGTTGSSGHSAPLNSPSQVTSLTIASGLGLRFRVTGTVNGTPADGRSGCFRSAEFGISRMDALCETLVGVFLADTSRTQPPQVNFDGDARELPVLRPMIQQPFVIGSGKTQRGEPKTFVVPAGATKLYLAAFRTPSSTGSFEVATEVAPIPELPSNPVRVSGTSWLWLAGQAAGAVSDNFSSPLNAPAEVLVPLVAGQALRIVATGSVDGASPDGRSGCFAGTESGLSRLDAPCSSLVGVFLADTRRTTPPALNFSGELKNRVRLEPMVQQPFFVGGGYTAGGELKQFIVPAGATRLFLASFRLPGSTGSFLATVSPDAPTTPTLTSAGILKAAGFGGGALSPGSIASLFGTNIAPATAAAESVPLPALLAGTRVYFNLVGAPLYFTSASQANVQVPWEISDEPSVQLVVTRNGAASMPINVPVAAANPGIFLTGPDAGVVVNASTGQLVNAASPASKGDVLVIFASGLGPVSGDTVTGSTASTTELQPTKLPVQAVLTAGGRDIVVPVLFAGLAPGFIGVNQVNLIVPGEAAAGIARLKLRTSTGESNVVSIAIR